MNAEQQQKITAAHLARRAYLYVRQSTLRQVFENTESTKRQYALRERAIALGWPLDQIVVIDSDQGQSGADSDRAGFQRLVAAVGVGEVGLVIGLEVSRLARNSADWHRLLEICALSDTLILDEDGLYDPAHFNDRLLLGLKGTMSEAELHVLRARLIGGQRAKAARGELEMRLPVGLVEDGTGQVVLDPDQQVQAAVRSFFATFARTGSATATVRAFREQGLLFPRRLATGAHKDELVWGPLRHNRTLRALKNPRYAGAFTYGRTRQRHLGGGHVRVVRLPREQWHTLIQDVHPGYISWAEYEANLERLHQNAQANGAERRKSPPREGPALLQGLAICGRCGERMSVRYHCVRGERWPEYLCQREAVENAQPLCQRIVGRDLDRAIGELVVETVTPLALEATLTIQEELRTRAEEADRLRHQQVERARYESEIAQRRYLRVDPDNRLVATSLEAEWNGKLRALAAAQDEYERQRAADLLALGESTRAEILALATDVPRLWRDPATSARDRKRMLRLLLEDVTLTRTDQVAAQVRFRGGATRTLALPLPRSAAELRKVDPAVVAAVDQLLDDHTDARIIEILAARGMRPGVAERFSPTILSELRHSYGLADRFTRLRRRGLLTLSEMAVALGIHPATVKSRRSKGLLASELCNDKGQRLYVPPGEPMMATCLHCGRPMPQRGSHGSLRKYCRVSCRTSAYAARRAASGWVRRRERRHDVVMIDPAHEVQSVA